MFSIYASYKHYSVDVNSANGGTDFADNGSGDTDGEVPPDVLMGAWGWDPVPDPFSDPNTAEVDSMDWV